MKNIIFVLLIILLLILIFYNGYSYKNIIDNFLDGLFVISDEFGKKSELDGMLLYIGYNEDSLKKAYLVMHGDGMVLMDKKIEINFQSFDFKNLIVMDKIYKKIEIIDNDTDNTELNMKDIMPLELNCEIDISKGRMIWLDDDDTVYAEFYKDNILSN